MSELSIAEAEQKIQELQAFLERSKAEAFDAKVAEVQGLIDTFGITADRLKFPTRRRSDTGRKIPIKYADGAGNTWSGRGRHPGWVDNAIASGVSLKDLEV